MLYSPQKEHVSGHFVRLIGIISGVHIAVLTALFISEYLGSHRPIVMGMGGGARVQMIPGRSGKGGSGTGQAPREPMQSPNQQAGAPIAEKNPQPIAEKEPVKKEVVAKKNEQKAIAPVQAPPIKKEAVKEKPAPKEIVPSSSALKKRDDEKPGFSPLTKKDPAKAEKAPLTSVTGTGFSALTKKQETQTKTKKTEPQQVEKGATASQSGQISQNVSSNQSHGASGSGYSAHQGGGSSSAPGEMVEIHGDEPGWSDNEYSREFFRFYAEPPGFKDRESFTISFDIKEGKASNISPRGAEPVALYAAAKSAILAMTFARTSYNKRVTFVI